MALALCACGSKGSDTIKGTYSMHVGGYDWGCATDKIILSLDYVLDAVAVEDFVVEVALQVTLISSRQRIKQIRFCGIFLAEAFLISEFFAVSA